MNPRYFCIALVIIAAIALITAPSDAFAQSPETMSVRIPFNFYLEERPLPAGNYQFTRSQRYTGCVLMRNADNDFPPGFVSVIPETNAQSEAFNGARFRR